MKEGLDALGDSLLYALSLSSVAIIVTMLLSFPLGAYAFNSPALGGASRSEPVYQLPLMLFGIAVPLPLPFPLSIGSLFILTWCINLTLFIFVLLGPCSGIIHAIRRLRNDKSIALYSNAALSIGVLFPVSLILASLMELLLNSVGISVGSLSTSDPRFLFLLSTFAPFREEIGFRVSFIGLASFIIAYSHAGRLSSLKALWHPSRALGEAGIQVWKEGWLIAAILISSLAFGAAHVLYGGGWGLGKFVSATVIGLILAAVYFTHGFPAAVILHWGFDYYQSSFLYFDQVRGVLDSSGNPLPGSLLYSTSFYVEVLIVLSVAIFFLTIAVAGLDRLLSKRPLQSPFKPEQSSIVAN